jgi:hypothetical protein
MNRTPHYHYQEPFFIKIYIVLLFLLGIVICFSTQEGNKRRAKSDVELDNKVIGILSNNSINQGDIIAQYAKEMEDKTALWTQYHKKIRIRDIDYLDKFDFDFRELARSMNLGLTKTLNADGSITYEFYSTPKMVYSNITFIVPRGSIVNKGINK